MPPLHRTSGPPQPGTPHDVKATLAEDELLNWPTPGQGLADEPEKERGLEPPPTQVSVPCGDSEQEDVETGDVEDRGPERERRPAARGRLWCQWGVRARLILAKTFARQRALGHGSEMV